MPVPHVDVQNGSMTNGPLTKGGYFKWSNPTGNPVPLSNCEGFCTASDYSVPAAVAGGGNGTADAQILPNPTSYTFTDPAWNAPGVPRIVVNPEPTPMEAIDREHHEHHHHHEHKKDVA